MLIPLGIDLQFRISSSKLGPRVGEGLDVLLHQYNSLFL